MAKDSKKRKSPSETNYFATYKTKAAKNRAKRLARHMKNHPNDSQAKNAGTEYRRKTPQKRGGWLTKKEVNEIRMGEGSPEAYEILLMTTNNKREYAQFSKMKRKADNRIAHGGDLITQEAKRNKGKNGYAG